MGTFYDYRRDGISQSILAGFLKCRRYADLHLKGYESKRQDSFALAFGTFAHEVLDRLYSRGKLPKPRIVKLYVNRVRNKLKINNPEMVGTLKVLLPEYFKHWSKDFDKRKWVELEGEFANDFLGVKKLLRGKRDAVFTINKKLWLLERKTKSRVEEGQITATLNIDLQVLFYLYNLGLETKKTPQGVIYDVIRRPGLRKRVGESPNAFFKRIRADIRKRPDWYFKRFECPISQDELQTFYVELKYLIKEFMAWQDGKRKTYKNPTSCINVYGMCKFIPICSNGDFSSFQKRKAVHNELSGVKA